MKKAIAILLSAVMVFGLAACAGTGTAETTAKAETTTEAATQAAGNTSADNASDSDVYVIDVLTEGPYSGDTRNTVVGKYIADNFGIAFNYISYAGDMQEKQALMLASGDYNELQYMQHNTVKSQYVNAGVLLNLDDYKDILPDFYKRFEQIIPYWRASSVDGQLNYFDCITPYNTPALNQHFDIMVRSDVLEHYGYPQLNSATDWINFLKQAVVDFPTTADGQATVGLTIPYAEAWGPDLTIGGTEGRSAQYYPATAVAMYDYTNQKFEDRLENDEVKESIKFFNDLYTEGLLDEECFTDTLDMTVSKMSDGRAIAAFYVTWEKAVVNTALTDAGHPEMSYIEMPFQLDSQAGKDRITPGVFARPYLSYGITDKCKDPERLLKFINWCCTDEGQTLLQSGLEGVHYTRDENGKRVPTELRLSCSADSNVGLKEGLMDGEMCMWRGIPISFDYAEDGQPYNLSHDQEYIDSNSLTDREKEVYAAMGWESSNAPWEKSLTAPDFGYYQSCDVDSTSDLGKTAAKMGEVFTKFDAQLVMADDFDAKWNEMIAEYDLLDHKAVIDEMNRTLDKYLGR